MLQKILKGEAISDRSDDVLGQEAMSTGALVRLMIRDYLWPNRWLLAISMVSMAFVGAATGARKAAA